MSAKARSASLIVKLTAALLVVIGLTSVAFGVTTIGGRPGYVYDAPTIARVGVHTFGHIDARTAQVTGVLEWSASPSAEARRTSTTSLAVVNATEAADEAAAATAARPPGPYVRPSGATTAAQRASVQGLPCVECGACHASPGGRPHLSARS